MSSDKVITKLKQKVAFLEAELARAQDENTIWERIFTENYWGMVVSDSISGEILKTNPHYAAMHGYSIPELIGKSMKDVYAPDCQKDLSEIVRIIHESGHYAYNSVHLKKDGSTFPVHVDAHDVTVNGKDYRVVSVWDITENELKEKELNQSREDLEQIVKLRIGELRVINKQLRSEIIQKEAAKNELHKANHEMVNLLESINDGFLAVNRKWVITYANKAMVEARKANGLHNHLVGSDYWQIYKNDNKLINDFCLQVMENGQPIRFESYAPLIGYWADFSIYPTANGISIFCRNIEARKQAERELARLDRLNLVGEMAAGIAHEVRNPMTTVRGFLQMLGSKDDTKQYHEFYDLMIEELDRANLILTDFLNLARDNPSDFKLTNISKVVKSLSPLLLADALNQEKDLELKLEQVADIHGNENELRQLILNLARNGLEAMPRGTLLTIQTHILGNHIILKIRDRGSGFDPVILEKLGTPFLTTKERGTGLGLAICHSIAARHKAEINFDSNPTGTTVTVKFAVAD
ncbi:MAG: ATP-binding protein [Desulfitobacteriaceae bacterium]